MDGSERLEDCVLDDDVADSDEEWTPAGVVFPTSYEYLDLAKDSLMENAITNGFAFEVDHTQALACWCEEQSQNWRMDSRRRGRLIKTKKIGCTFYFKLGRESERAEKWCVVESRTTHTRHCRPSPDPIGSLPVARSYL